MLYSLTVSMTMFERIHKKTILLLCLGMMTGQVQAQKFPTIRYEDYTYETGIKTVALYPQPNQPNDPARTTYPPVIAVGGSRPLIGEFDDLTAQYRSLRYKIFHCNADWTLSSLSDIEYTFEYNDYPINDYQASFNTKIAYYQYRFEVPRLKLAGNYVLAVYEDTRPAKLLLTRRFMVYGARVSILPQVRISSGIAEQRSHQQIDFDLSFKGYEVLSPQDDFKVVIRQNFRWDKVLTKLRPSNVRIFDQKVEYRPFDLSNNMPAFNEFRWFDTRLARGVGMSVGDIQQLPEHTIARLRDDMPRGNGGANLQNQDFNGQYIVLNRDTGNSTNEADYLNVVFTLRMPPYSNAEVYVLGGFNLWQRNDASRMTYDPQKQAYQAGIYVKQGIVNYAYLAVQGEKTDDTILEGNFSTTANDYEIFVYHRPPAARADVLVGYRLIEFGRQ